MKSTQLLGILATIIGSLLLVQANQERPPNLIVIMTDDQGYADVGFNGCKDIRMIVGDVRFRKPGGFDPADYIPQNTGLIKDQGIEIPLLQGDDVGLRIGLKVTADFLGNPIVGKPDIGAIEIN